MGKHTGAGRLHSLLDWQNIFRTLKAYKATYSVQVLSDSTQINWSMCADVTTDSLSTVFMRLESLVAFVEDNLPELAKLIDLKVGNIRGGRGPRYDDHLDMAKVKAELIARWDPYDERNPKFYTNGYMFYNVSRYAIQELYNDQQRAKYEAQRLHNMLNHKEAK